jgi:hypothetical protein
MPDSPQRVFKSVHPRKQRQQDRPAVRAKYVIPLSPEGKMFLPAKRREIL